MAVGRFGSAAGPLLAGFFVGIGQTPTQVIATMLPIIGIAGAAAAFVGWSTQRHPVVEAKVAAVAASIPAGS